MSQRLNEFLASEAGDYLERMTRLLSASASPDPDELLRLVRGIRGSARMAGAVPVADAAQRLEERVAQVALGRSSWSAETRESCLRGVQELERLLYGAPEGIVPISQLFYDDEGPHVFPPRDGSGEPVPIETLLYRGDAALARALELRPALAASVVDGDAATAAALIDEIFDLIQLARPRAS